MSDQSEIDPLADIIVRLEPLAAKHGLSRRAVELWLGAPTTYFRDESAPADHLDDPELIFAVAERAWGIVW